MKVFDELVARGLIAQVTNEEEIREMVDNGKATFYIGFDPTADSLHVGHFMALCLMKRLQMAGNKPIALIGGGTAMIGDPSGRTDMRSMMTKETWFTGREALEKGFADAIKEDEDDPEMSMSADRKVLFVNGVRHNVDGLQHVPGTIPVKAIATPPAAKPGANKKKPTAKAAKKEGGNKPMDEKELRAAYPEIVAQIEASARTEAQNASGEAVAAERQRIEQIDSIAASIPDQQLVHDAKYGDNPCTAQELCFRVMQASAASGQNFLAAYQAEGAKSGAADVGAAPNGGAPANAQEQDAADIQAVVSAYNQTKGGTK